MFQTQFRRKCCRECGELIWNRYSCVPVSLSTPLKGRRSFIDNTLFASCIWNAILIITSSTVIPISIYLNCLHSLEGNQIKLERSRCLPLLPVFLYSLYFAFCDVHFLCPQRVTLYRLHLIRLRLKWKIHSLNEIHRLFRVHLKRTKKKVKLFISTHL